jgi:putative oxygen-independent coproporphyrinogen III oxidase
VVHAREDGAVIDRVVRHIYVHVPFCATVCPFCSFDVVERRAGQVDAYLDRLAAEAVVAAEQFDVVPTTLYLGGGTPSHLRIGELARIVDVITRVFGRPSGETTIEVHPLDAGEGKVAALGDLGFNRLSVGVQSFDDRVLASLGRAHTGAAARTAIERCLATGATVSLDLISAVEGQDLGSDLAAAVASGVHHMSVYTLTVEDGTPFARRGVQVPDDRAAGAIERTARVLGSAGFDRYEVSNYARPGRRSTHNQAYWRNRWVLGLGPSAGGHLPPLDADRSAGAAAVRTANAPMAAWSGGAPPEAEALSPREAAGDHVFCGLRLSDGVDLAEGSLRWGVDIGREFAAEIESLRCDGLVELDGTVLRATDAGYRVLDRVAAEFC